MKTKIILFILSVMTVPVWAGTPVQVVVKNNTTQKIQFAYGSIDNTIYWKQTDYNTQLAADAPFSTATATAVTYTPTAFEISLTTCPITSIGTLSDFNDAQTQAGIMPYLDQLWIRITTYGSSNQNVKSQKAQSCYDYLSSVAKTLP